MGMSEDWRNFLQKSKKKKTLPESLRERVVEEFKILWDMLMHNERPTRVAAQVCVKYPEYNVAGVLNPHITD